MLNTSKLSRVSSLLLLSLGQNAWAAPSNDGLASAIDFTGKIPYSIQQSTLGATTESGELMSKCSNDNKATVWYKFIPSVDQQLSLDAFGSDYDTNLSVWTGTSHPLTEVACNDDSSRVKQSQLNWQFKAGITYYIAIGGYTGETGNLIFNVTPVAALTNDKFSDAINITKFPFTAIQSTVNATVDANEASPDCAISGSGSSVWYKYTPSSNQMVVFDTFDSDYNTVLSVWTGSTQPLTQVACNDNMGAQQSQVIVNLTAGTSYFVNVGGVLSNGVVAESGNLVLHLSAPPANDNLSAAKVINSLPFDDSMNAAGASNETAEVTPSCGVSSNSVWYKYTPSTTQNVSFATLKSNYDTVLSVWTGSTHPLTEVLCNDDAITSDDQEKTSQVALTLNAGTPYFINVSGNYGGSGSLIFHAETVVSDLKITQQPKATVLKVGQSATLIVSIASSSASKNITYQWFEGGAGNTARAVGDSSNVYTTPELTRNTSYWVRITSPKGSVDSDVATVTVDGATNSVGIDLQGKSLSTTANFGLKVASNQRSGNNIKIAQTDNVSLSASINADPAHIGKNADIVMVGIYNGSAFVRNNTTWTTWDGNISSLSSAQQNVKLSTAVPVSIFDGSFNGLPGNFTVYVGYRVDNSIVFNGNEPISFLVQ
jgi:Icc-related predicted phosphoesterase